MDGIYDNAPAHIEVTPESSLRSTGWTYDMDGEYGMSGIEMFVQEWDAFRHRYQALERTTLSTATVARWLTEWSDVEQRTSRSGAPSSSVHDAWTPLTRREKWPMGPSTETSSVPVR